MARDPRDERAVSCTDAVGFAVAEAEACRSITTFDDDLTIAGFRTYAGRRVHPSVDRSAPG